MALTPLLNATAYLVVFVCTNPYFLMFLHLCLNVGTSANYEKIALNALNTYTLGEHVGWEWGIGKALKWKLMLDP